MNKKRIVIIGGGFAGVKCAKVLRGQLSSGQYEIVLFNQENHMVFHPLLAEVVGASLSPENVAAPLRQMLPKVHCRTEDILNVDLEKSFVEFDGPDGRMSKMPYDHVVFACGGVVNLGAIPGMSDSAFPLKTIGDAIALRAHVMQQLEKAEVCEDPELKRQYLSFIVVGGGYSGVETAGEINDLAQGSRRFFQNIGKDEISVTLIHSQDQILPEIGADLRDFALKKMNKHGIKFLLNSRVKLATPDGVGLTDGRFVRGGTIVCTIGTAPSPVIARLNAQKEKGRVVTEPDMRLKGFKNAWAIGDCAVIPNAFDNKPAPPTGQFAEREGRQTALNIIRVFNNEPTKPFYFKPLGQLCSIGGHTAVAEMMGIHLSGFFAWFVWRGVYLMKLPSWSRRIKVGFDWAWEMIFFRDLTHLRAHQTERVSRAFYQAGDVIFKQGDPGENFYVIEKGEVDVVREGPTDAEDEVIAVLGNGSFFGEMALLNNGPRTATIRARTAVEVVVMGRKIFEQVSGALAPVRRLLTQAVTRRTGDFWQQYPEVRDTLRRTPVIAFAETENLPVVGPDQTFAQVAELLNRKKLDYCLVSRDGFQLDGIITPTQIYQALETGAKAASKVTDVMCPEPVMVTREDSTLAAAATMRDKNLTWLPVVSNEREKRILGIVKAQSLVTRLLSGKGANVAAEAALSQR